MCQQSGIKDSIVPFPKHNDCKSLQRTQKQDNFAAEFCNWHPQSFQVFVKGKKTKFRAAEFCFLHLQSFLCAIQFLTHNLELHNGIGFCNLKVLYDEIRSTILQAWLLFASFNFTTKSAKQQWPKLLLNNKVLDAFRSPKTTIIVQHSYPESKTKFAPHFCNRHLRPFYVFAAFTCQLKFCGMEFDKTAAWAGVDGATSLPLFLSNHDDLSWNRSRSRNRYSGEYRT